MSKSEGWEGGEEGFAALRLPFGLPFGREHFVVASLRESHTGLAADSCCKTSSSASRFKERGGGVAKIAQGRCGCDSKHTVYQAARTFGGLSPKISSYCKIALKTVQFFVILH